MRARHRFSVALALCTWGLIWVGALVTSTESGLAVPDWPLSYGMFFPPMVGGVFYEHGHRMVAAFVGLLTLAVALWTWRSEPRAWVRRLALAALAMVVLQGALGGITVLYLLPTAVSVSHATLAQTFFCATILLAFATSEEWKQRGFARDAIPLSLRRAAPAVTLLVYLQLIAGAAVRHTGSAFAIPDFPLAFGRLVPPLWDVPIAIHFTHRLGGAMVTAGAAFLILGVWRHVRRSPSLLVPALLLGGLVLAQIVLGGAIVWSGRAVWAATAHVATGALVLATAWLLTLKVHLATATGRRREVSA